MIKLKRVKPTRTTTINPKGNAATDLVAFFQDIALGWHFRRLEGNKDRTEFIFSCCARISVSTICPGIRNICKTVRATPENAALLFDMFYYNALGKLPVNPADSEVTEDHIARFESGEFGGL